MNNSTSFTNKLNQLKGKQSQLKESLIKSKIQSKHINRNLKYHEQAREIIREVGLKTQQQLQYHIGDITSLALEHVFDDPYTLKAQFVQRRNKTECDLLFVRDKKEVDPLSATGGGAVDIASFALRLVSWSMSYPKPNNTIILDEPFRFLSVDKQEQASYMLKELGNKLSIQFIIVTHEEELTQFADNNITTKIRKGVTHCI